MEFKNGEYIVITDASFVMDGYTIGKIYQQRTDSYNLHTYLDDKESRFNGYDACNYDNTGDIKWRYATNHEIDLYDENNKTCFVGVTSSEQLEGEPDYTKEIEDLLMSFHVE